MKVTPYLYCNGNCKELIALYEKAFNAEAEIALYGDEPPGQEYQSPPGSEGLVMHARMKIGGEVFLYLCDMPPQEKNTLGDALSIHMELEENAAKAAFDALKDGGGKITMELQPAFWAKGGFGSLVDKFGVSWMIEY